VQLHSILSSWRHSRHSLVIPSLLAVGAMAMAPFAQAQALPATVLSIGDGDTIRVRQAGRAVTVRLACIDAPETAQSPYGHEARRYLQQRLPIGREVSLDVKTTNRYGRTVAEVFSGVNINLAVVEDGQGRHRQAQQGLLRPSSGA
jgi:endonuclease YncB( thermonuclease family)